MEIKKIKSTYLYLFICSLILFVMIIQICFKNYGNLCLCLFAIFLICIFKFIIKKFHLKLPFCLEALVCIFVFSSQILGEVYNFYEIIPCWDNILHFITGFIMSSVGVSFLFMIFHEELKPFNFILCFVLCFSMTITVFWEFGEFFVDNYFGRDCQKDTLVNNISSVDFNTFDNKPISIDDISETHIYSNNGKKIMIIYGGYLDLGIQDTIRDLFVNFIGCIFYIIFYFFDCKRKNYFFRKYLWIIREE